MNSDLLQVFKALADETRLRLLAVLAQGDFNVNELIEILRMGQSRISRHLKILAECGLVVSRREGHWTFYSLTPPNGRVELGEAASLALKAAARLRSRETDLQQIESIVQRRRQASQRYFDRVGPEWERLQREVLDSSYYREHVLRHLPQGRESAADLGAGAGLLLPALLQRFQRVIAIDSSRTMLRVAADYVAQEMPAALARCDFRLGEIEHLPLPDAAVEAAVACMVLHHVSQPAGALAEIFRILKPGGTLVIADLLQHEVVEMREKYADLWLGFKRADLNKWLIAAGFAPPQSEILAKNETMKVLIFQATKP
ncbi:MAG: metalloregulator ArsR/SmtB family transcription factor [candidate division KSB1 bacterium]|nr:metalloregulator ArsR/SmtB family transcription factor [candidate division KSB1 bacterium]MDZ7276469.1 metalloregulator ArsR/SmtB family transcription factor [candidate division KSB1 bacterium]MDZ7286750.1 metalloregulator ArsR/SmtB family transcription factor [candidate division KSB1 bacterium]MDZ7300239.1 metalloregulator ArsR/SmtB family transcription factor [candidate division KSB1 bacterium]MDZ7306745.1 metalloregulator ArsR/SmtB family transcription factor [candidate division KSB1 bact